MAGARNKKVKSLTKVEIIGRKVIRGQNQSSRNESEGNHRKQTEARNPIGKTNLSGRKRTTKRVKKAVISKRKGGS
jgi:hypothetical protein